MSQRSPFLAPSYVNGIYIPTGLLLFGVYIVKKDWLPYAAALAVALASLQIFNNCKLPAA